jgi:hypothetical protein
MSAFLPAFLDIGPLKVESSMGIENGLRSMKLKRVSMDSMYDDCNNEIVHAS